MSNETTSREKIDPIWGKVAGILIRLLGLVSFEGFWSGRRE
jgi:hypothetical protein